MSGDPHAPRRVSATIKHPESKRYAADNPWLVFEGDVQAVREQLIEAFGMSDTDGLTLAELVSEAQSQFTAIGNAKAGLGGGQVLSRGSSEASEGSGNAWDKVGSSSESKPEENPLLVAIEAAKTVEELKQIWAENQDAFGADEELMGTWKAKGRALKEASA